MTEEKSLTAAHVDLLKQKQALVDTQQGECPRGAVVAPPREKPTCMCRVLPQALTERLHGILRGIRARQALSDTDAAIGRWCMLGMPEARSDRSPRGP